ncbi:MAG: bile acid:sodium symporter family protein, partial [Trichormus sp.]
MQANLLTNVILPLSLVIIMLGMGLSLQLADFQRVTKYPKAVSVGLVSQLVVLPMIGFAITKILPMQPAIAVGLIIVTLCPGATSSNIVTYLA